LKVQPQEFCGVANAPQEDKVIPHVPLAACLQQWQEVEEMNDYFSAALNFKTKALKNTRLTNFPPFLLVQLNRCPPPYSPCAPLSRHS